MGDGSCFENRRAMSLEGSTPSPSAVMCSWPSGRGASPGHRPKVGLLARWVRIPQGTLHRRELPGGYLYLEAAERSEVGNGNTVADECDPGFSIGRIRNAQSSSRLFFLERK